MRRLAASYDDKTIAAVLGKQHRRTATGLPWTRPGSRILRAQHRIPACQPQTRKCRTRRRRCARGHDQPKPRQILGVSRVTLYRWLRDGFITGEQMTPGAPWQIRIDQALRDKIRPRHPTAGYPWTPPPKPSASPARPCCIRSSAASCKPSTSTADAAKACVSRSNPNKLDCSTHPINRKVQC